MCERRHYYAFGERLERVTKSISLDRGITGHTFMHIFFQILKDTRNWDEAKDKLNAALAEALISAPNRFEILSYCLLTINQFLDFYRERIEQWDIIEVEQTHRLDCGDFDFAFTVDALIRENGRVKVVDWKFVYDFYDDDSVQLLPQIPRYIGALQTMGMTVSGGYLGFLRYRNVKAQGEGNRFLLHPVNPMPERIKNSFADLIKSVSTINDKKRMPLQEWHESVRRTANMTVCKTCSFKDLCVAELNGSDGKNIRMVNFKPSTYGYDSSDV